MKKKAWSFEIRAYKTRRDNIRNIEHFALITPRYATWGNRKMFEDKIREVLSMLDYEIAWMGGTKTQVDNIKCYLINYENIGEYFKHALAQNKKEEYVPKGGHLKVGTRLQIDRNNPKNHYYSGIPGDGYTVAAIISSHINKEELYVLSFITQVLKTDIQGIPIVDNNSKAIWINIEKFTLPLLADDIFSWLAIIEPEKETAKKAKIKPIEPQVRTKTEDQG